MDINKRAERLLARLLGEDESAFQATAQELYTALDKLASSLFRNRDFRAKFDDCFSEVEMATAEFEEKGSAASQKLRTCLRLLINHCQTRLSQGEQREIGMELHRAINTVGAEGNDKSRELGNWAVRREQLEKRITIFNPRFKWVHVDRKDQRIIQVRVGIDNRTGNKEDISMAGCINLVKQAVYQNGLSLMTEPTASRVAPTKGIASVSKVEVTALTTDTNPSGKRETKPPIIKPEPATYMNRSEPFEKPDLDNVMSPDDVLDLYQRAKAERDPVKRDALMKQAKSAASQLDSIPVRSDLMLKQLLD